MRISQNKIAEISLLCLMVFWFTPVVAQQTLNTKLKVQPVPAEVGVLLLAHGGNQSWNDEVLKVATVVEREMPVEVAFGMANKRAMQDGIDKLTARGVKQIVAVPLFVSSHSSVITSSEYLLGLRKDPPADLALFARMNHSHGTSGGSMASMDAGASISPAKSRLPIRMAAALDNHPLVAEILLERARSISQEPPREVVFLLAHGPVPDDDNAKWLADMKTLAKLMKPRSNYQRIEYLTLRDDAPERVRAHATAELRTRVETAIREGNKVLIVPLLLSYGGIEQGIKKRLEGLDYTISKYGLLPDDRLARWVRESATAEAR